MERKKVTIPQIVAMKNKEKITMLTAYDYPTAMLVDKAGIEMILVGDSVGMVIMGLDSTVPVTMDEMIHHTKAVVRGNKSALVVADLPFMSYNVSVEEAIRNAGRFLKEAGADAVKLEGGVNIKDTVRAVVNAGIPVVGHIGLTPQTSGQLGGFKVQGRDDKRAAQLKADALALQEAGAFCIVLELIPADLAKMITESVDIPTIGIGAGIDCDGQVLVYQDMLGLFDKFTPRFVKQYLDIGSMITKAFEDYKNDVKEARFPEEKHTFR